MPRPLRALLRTLLLSTLAYWLGGTLFYISVVIHTAHDVLGSQRDVGFVTREVTRHLNFIGLAVLALLLLNIAASSVSRSRARPRAPAFALLLTWLLMAILQAGLFALHPRIDHLLDPAAHRVLDRQAFKPLHNLYMTVTTLLIAAGIAHCGVLVSVWSAKPPDPAR